MAEVVSALLKDQIGNYMQADELLDSQRREVYEAVGEQLMWCYEFDGEIPPEGDLLVELSGGQKVAYSYGECIDLDAIG